MVAAFLDGSIKMGFGLLTPLLLVIYKEPVVIIAVTLLTQMFVGFSETIFHAYYRRTSPNQEARKYTFIFTVITMIGVLVGVILLLILPEIVILIYIGLMIISIGIFILLNILSLINVTGERMYLIGLVSGFNQGMSGAGYGPLAKFYQSTLDDTTATKWITSLSEAIISGFGFVIIMIFRSIMILDFQLLIVLAISGVIASPLGCILREQLSPRKMIKSLVGVLSILLGIILLIGVYLGIF